MVKAVAVVRGDSKVSGTVKFEQAAASDPVSVLYDISGNDPNALRGFHIHQFGDNTNGCTSAGPHFNPFKKQHGAPEAEERHVGDLGNIKANDSGLAKGSLSDKQLTLFGDNSIVGRTVVVHAGTDDLGKNEGESKVTGNAGGRNACGVIGISA